MYQHFMKPASRNRRKKIKELNGKSLHKIKKWISGCLVFNQQGNRKTSMINTREWHVRGLMQIHLASAVLNWNSYLKGKFTEVLGFHVLANILRILATNIKNLFSFISGSVYVMRY